MPSLASLFLPGPLREAPLLLQPGAGQSGETRALPTPLLRGLSCRALRSPGADWGSLTPFSNTDDRSLRSESFPLTLDSPQTSPAGLSFLPSSDI